MCNSCGCSSCGYGRSFFGLDSQTIILIILLWFLFCSGSSCGSSRSGGCGCNSCENDCGC